MTKGLVTISFVVVALFLVIIILSTPVVYGSAPGGISCNGNQIDRTMRQIASANALRPVTLFVLRNEIDEKRPTLLSFKVRTKFAIETSIFRKRKIAAIFCSTSWTHHGKDLISTLPLISAQLKSEGINDEEAWSIATCLSIEHREIPRVVDRLQIDKLKSDCKKLNRQWPNLYR
jgi:hypothetical protein